MGERTVRIRKVKGSNPSVSTIQESSFCLARQKSFFVVNADRVNTQACVCDRIGSVLLFGRKSGRIDLKGSIQKPEGFDLAGCL